MKRRKVFEIKKGNIIYRDEMEFRTLFHELFWKIKMKGKGRIVKEFVNNRNSL